MTEQSAPKQQKNDRGISEHAEPDFVQNSAREKHVNIETFEIENKGWGYDVLVNGQKYIHQEHIPAIQGVQYFKTAEDARKTAELVKYKIELNILPPSLTRTELDSLGVDY